MTVCNSSRPAYIHLYSVEGWKPEVGVSNKRREAGLNAALCALEATDQPINLLLVYALPANEYGHWKLFSWKPKHVYSTVYLAPLALGHRLTLLSPALGLLGGATDILISKTTPFHLEGRGSRRTG